MVVVIVVTIVVFLFCPAPLTLCTLFGEGLILPVSGTVVPIGALRMSWVLEDFGVEYLD